MHVWANPKKCCSITNYFSFRLVPNSTCKQVKITTCTRAIIKMRKIWVLQSQIRLCSDVYNTKLMYWSRHINYMYKNLSITSFLFRQKIPPLFHIHISVARTWDLAFAATAVNSQLPFCCQSRIIPVRRRDDINSNSYRIRVISFAVALFEGESKRMRNREYGNNENTEAAFDIYIYIYKKK